MSQQAVLRACEDDDADGYEPTAAADRPCADGDESPRKRTAQDEDSQRETPLRKKQKMLPDEREGVKVSRGDSLASPAGSQVVCIIDQADCIPLWPQYVLDDDKDATEAYIKVAPYEAWLTSYCSLLRRKGLKASDPTEKKSAQFSRELGKICCTKIVPEFRKVLVEHKKNHKKKFGESLPREHAVKFNGFPVLAANRTRQLLLRADADTLKWIKGGFKTAFLNIVKEASTAASQTHIDCGLDKVDYYSGLGLGVRDKITWSSQLQRWKLQGIPNIDVDDYCKRESLMVHVVECCSASEYKKSRQQALLHACIAWNALNKDRSKRCIKLPQSAAKVQVLASQSYLDSDNESEDSASGGEGCKPNVLAQD